MRQVMRLGLAIVLLATVAGCGNDNRGSTASIPKRDIKPLTAAERAKVAREQRANTGHGRPASDRAGRAALVGDLERAITTDARERVRAHELKGPILRSACDATRDDDHVFSCTAVTEELKAVGKGKKDVNGVLGHPFTGVIHFDSGDFAWCKRDLSPGEGGVIDPRRIVPLPAACQA